MKCIIISDSHHSPENIGRVIAKNPDAEVVFYLGDGISSLDKYIERYPDKAWLYVLGNCDSLTVVNGTFCTEKTGRITICGKRIVFTHGDLYGVKYARGGLIKLADDEKADIVLFGHTHMPEEKYISERELWLFNPGSLEASFSSPPSFGLMTLTDKGDVLLSHGTL